MEKLGLGDLATVHHAKFQGTVGAVKLCRDQGFLTSAQMEMDRDALQAEAMLLHRLKQALFCSRDFFPSWGDFFPRPLSSP